MIKEKKLYLGCLLILLTYSCGFNIADPSKLNGFNIINITSEGEKRINYKLKNKLLFNKDQSNKKRIELTLNTKSNRSIREKNIKNEITKYQIEIKVDVQVSILNNQNSISFVTRKSGNYNIGAQYSLTLRNEKKLVDLLIEELSKEIYTQLNTRLNDL